MNGINPFLESFRLHDEQGVPLAVAVAHGGARVNVALFFFDALAAGWDPDTAIDTIRVARVDNGLPFDEREFGRHAAMAWVIGGRTWAGAARYIRRAIANN